MDAGFTQGQADLRDSVRSVLAAECPPSVVREAYDDHSRWLPLWKTIVQLGWLALAGPESTGGLGVVELMGALEAAGGAVAPIPFLSTVGFAGGALRFAGDRAVAPTQRLMSGAPGCLVVDTVRRLPAATVRYEDGRLSGSVSHVMDAARAEVFVIAATDPAGESVIAVVSPGPGLTVRSEENLDQGRPTARVDLDVKVDWVAPVPLDDIVSVPMLAAAADLVGLADRVLRFAVDHATNRTQFSVPIGSFQGVKHLLADCYVSLERARSLTYAAAMTCADPTSAANARWLACAMAKAAGSEAADLIVRSAVQVHGAIAQTWEHDLHLYVRRIWQSSALLGEPNALYAEVARQASASVSASASVGDRA